MWYVKLERGLNLRDALDCALIAYLKFCIFRVQTQFGASNSV